MVTKPRLRLGAADHGASVTHEEFSEAVHAEPWRYERVNGKLIVMAPCGQGHVDAAEPFRDHFVAYKLAHPGRIANVVSEAWIVIDDETERVADLGVYLKSTRSKGEIPYVAPDIVVEVVSAGYTSTRRDYEEKRSEYLRLGIKEYLIVDRFDRRVNVLRRGRGRYTETALGPGDTYLTPLLPGLKIPLVEIV